MADRALYQAKNQGRDGHFPLDSGSHVGEVQGLSF
jgi:hypothetical protein